MAWRLLIVEDDASLRQMLSLDLQELGYRVAAGGSCREAMTWACRQGFDVALVDYQLPDGDGLGLLECLRARDPHLQVFLYTGLRSPGLADRALCMGARDLLTKPVTADQLDACFKAALGKGLGLAGSPSPG
jgi:DNA-binding NtrC family response regulator